MTVRAELSSKISSTVPTHIRTLRRLLVTANRAIDSFPAQKQLITQLVTDGVSGMVAVLLAYQMHSDFAASTIGSQPMWVWALVMLFARPSSLMLLSRYRVPWHAVDVTDIAELSVASIPPSMLALSFCWFRRLSWAVVPTGVVAMELPLFIGMATGIRCFRRAAYEEDRRSRMKGNTTHASIVQSSVPNLVSQLVPCPTTNAPTLAPWDADSIDAYRGRAVLVTGAGGSIGSELSRKLSALPISQLLLLDNDETLLFELDRELEDCHVKRLPIIGDIRNKDFLRHIFERHRPQIILHAAAYKHVPMMEANPSAAILNNVIGTRNVVDAAIEAACERFLLISTDKAVNPVNVMGATKRIAELLIQSRSTDHPVTRFACVRFGNVLGSRGSVVPIFLKQIRAGKPITLTDVRMTRHFITPEQAADLVLLASTLGHRGEIFVLKTGDPMDIRELARRLAEQSGALDDGKVKFQLIGIRPGERLQESLWEWNANVLPTGFPAIYVVRPSGEIPGGLEQDIQELETLANANREAEIITKLQSLPIGYGPQREDR